MSKDFGEIEYDQSEYLNLAANYEEPEEKEINYAGIAELDIIDLKQEETEDDEELNEVLEKTEIEAKFVAQKIKKLIDSKYQVYDRKKGYRNIQFPPRQKILRRLLPLR